MHTLTCGACGRVETATDAADLTGWHVTEGTNGSKYAACAQCHAAANQPTDEPGFALDSELDGEEYNGVHKG